MELKGVDYFPFSIDFFEDNKIALIEAEFGSNAVVVLMKIFCKIYRNGFFCEWTPDDCMLFARKMMNGTTSENVQNIVDKALARGLFDRSSYERFEILTSVDVQKQFFLIAGRRKEVRIDKKDYLLIDVSPYKNICLGTQKSLKPEDVDILPGNVDILPENVDSAEQRKGKIKERKEKENKVKEISLTPFVPQASGREQWEIWKNELLEDEDWRASAVRQSGEGIGFNEMLPGKLNEFCDFIVSSGEQDTVGRKKDFTRRFHYWQSNHGTKKNFARAAQPERKSKIQEAIELGKAVTENAKRLGLI